MILREEFVLTLDPLADALIEVYVGPVFHPDPPKVCIRELVALRPVNSEETPNSQYIPEFHTSPGV